MEKFKNSDLLRFPFAIVYDHVNSEMIAESLPLDEEEGDG